MLISAGTPRRRSDSKNSSNVPASCTNASTGQPPYTKASRYAFGRRSYTTTMSKSDAGVASPRNTDPARNNTRAPSYLSRQIPRAVSSGESPGVFIAVVV
jgi:hypothetical protein